MTNDEVWGAFVIRHSSFVIVDSTEPAEKNALGEEIVRGWYGVVKVVGRTVA